MTQPALLIRLRPLGPWRSGPGDGGLDRVDTLFRSDRLFSAVTIAMAQLGLLEEWLDATARSASSTVAFSSLFPFQGDTLFAVPPATLWPPPAALVSAPNPVFLAKIRWKTARFVPLSIIDSLLAGEPLLAEQWLPDPESGCLLRRDRPNASPFRVTSRTSAAVDRLASQAAAITATACTEFESTSGLWTLVRYQDPASQQRWGERIQAAFRLLADSGFGGKRTSGWGQVQTPEFQSGSWPRLLLPKTGVASNNGSASTLEEKPRFWLLSLYSPAPHDQIDWTDGEYDLTLRAGRVQDGTRSGTEKKVARMIVEGSVLAATKDPAGIAVDVAPDGFDHPVYRSGIALAFELPVLAPRTETEVHMALQPVEELTAPEESIALPPLDEESSASETELEPVEAPPEPVMQREEDTTGEPVRPKAADVAETTSLETAAADPQAPPQPGEENSRLGSEGVPQEPSPARESAEEDYEI